MTKTVLIIDDVGFDRTILSALLRQSGYQVIDEASNGSEGIEKALKLQPDIITLDRRMPDMDGMEVLEHLRSQSYQKEIVLISGDDLSAIKPQAKELGVTCFFSKPVSRQELKEGLSKLNLPT